MVKLGHILDVELTGLADRLDMGGEGKLSITGFWL